MHLLAPMQLMKFGLHLKSDSSGPKEQRGNFSHVLLHPQQGKERSAPCFLCKAKGTLYVLLVHFEGFIHFSDFRALFSHIKSSRNN